MPTGLGTLFARPTASRAPIHVVNLLCTGARSSGSLRWGHTRPPLTQLPFETSAVAEDLSAKRRLNQPDPRIRYTLDPETPLISKQVIGGLSDGYYSLDLRPDLTSRLRTAECVDLEPWFQLLKRRARVDGSAGIELVWRAMRAQDIDLPCEGRLASPFWRTFARVKPLREELFDHAVYLRRSKNQTWPPLYERFMDAILRECLSSTLEWHSRFKVQYHIPPTALNWLVVAAASSAQSLEFFKSMYLDLKTDSNSAYDAMITVLCNQRKIKEALEMHAFLVGHGDRPSMAMKQSPMTELLQEFDKTISRANLVKPTLRAGRGLYAVESPDASSESKSVQTAVQSFAQKHKEEPVNTASSIRVSNKSAEEHADEKASPELQFSREVMYTFLGESHGIAPKQFSDDFCARLFATKAFSIPLVISCLNLFGIRSIGPMAMREMSLRAFHPKEVTTKIEELERAGISIGDSVFARAVRKLSADNNEDLLHSLLHSDQHPDVLEDVPTQRALLSSYIARNDWLSVYRTLTLLSLFHENPQQESWNILVRQYARDRNLDKVQQVLEDMRLKGIQVTSQTIKRIYSHLLIRRNPGKEPNTMDKYTRDDLRFVTNICLQFMETGQLLPADYWQELMTRYGLSGRFEELARLCVRLNTYYSQDWLEARSRWNLRAVMPANDPMVTRGIVDPKTTMLLPRRHRANPLRRIFSDSMIRSIIEWGFKQGFKHLREQPDRIRYSFMLANRRPMTDDFQWPTNVCPLSPEATYLRGINLVQQLVERGVYVRLSVIRRAITFRLWQLFSPGVSTRKVNQIAQKLNPHSLEHMLGAILKSWKGPPLFPKLLVNRAQVEQQVHRIMMKRQSRVHELQGKAGKTSLLNHVSNGVEISSEKKELTPSLPLVGPASTFRPTKPSVAWEDPFGNVVPISLPLIGLLSHPQPASPDTLLRDLFGETGPPSDHSQSVARLDQLEDQESRLVNAQSKVNETEGGCENSVNSTEYDGAALEQATVAAMPLDPYAANVQSSVFEEAWEASFEDKSSSIFSPTKLPRPKFPWFPTILDDLDKPSRHGSPGSNEKVERRKQIAFAMFGRAPVVGGVRSRFGKFRLHESIWERTVERWARGSEYKTNKFPRLFAVKSMGNGRDQMIGAIQRRRERQARLAREHEKVAQEDD